MKEISKNKRKFLKLVSNKPSDVMKNVEWRIKNSYWLRESFGIALRILDALDTQGLTKDDLNERTGISKVKINKILRGKYNISLKEIRKIENAINIKILSELK